MKDGGEGDKNDSKGPGSDGALNSFRHLPARNLRYMPQWTRTPASSGDPP